MSRIPWLLLAFCFVPAAIAHTQSTAYVDIAVRDAGPEDKGRDDTTTVDVEVDLALRDLALSLPLDANRDDAVTWGELQAVRPRLEAMVMDGFDIDAGGRACTLAPRGLAVRRYDAGTYATLRLRGRCPAADTLDVGYRLLFDRDPAHRALLTVHARGTTSSAVAHAGAPRVAVSLAGGHQVATFLREGVHHILVGYDHLAFLLSLLLCAPLVRREGQWRRAPSFRASFVHVVGIVTAFTVAHSITLALAALGWVTPASRWVEAAIAASVLLAALNNLRPVLVRRLWVAGFAFGLVHGFGFAGVLQELGLPEDARMAALVGFNLGVELGQVAAVTVALPVLYLCARRTWYSRVAVPVVSLAIGLLAGYWLLERLRD